MPLNVTDSLTNWQFQRSHIERNMDSAAYESAHPDDTLILAGPTRLSDINASEAPAVGAVAGASGTAQANVTGTPLLPIGAVQSMTWTSQKPTQPLMAIGSGRSFFATGKSQTNWNMARLMTNGRNLLHVMYHAAVTKGIDVSQFDDPAGITNGAQFLTNLDSELYSIPVGLGMLFRSKSHDWVGAFYGEACMINSYSIGLNAGASMVLEQVSGVCDRILPMSLAQVGATYAPRSTIDQIIGFASGQGPNRYGSGARTTSDGSTGSTARTSAIG